MNTFEYRSSTTTAAPSNEAKAASRYQSLPPVTVATKILGEETSPTHRGEHADDPV